MSCLSPRNARLLLLALLATVCVAASGCMSPGWSVLISESGQSWDSVLITESKPEGTENEFAFYVRVRHVSWSPFQAWIRFEASNMDYEWEPEYYWVDHLTNPTFRIQASELETCPMPLFPFQTRYLEVRVREPQAPSSHLGIALSFQRRGIFLPWADVGTVGAGILVPGNLMLTEGEASLFSEWLDEDIVVKTTDVDIAAMGDSHDYTLKAQAKDFTIRVRNLDNAVGSFVLREARDDFTGIVRYYAGAQEITPDVEGGGYHINALAEGQDFLIRMVVVPVGKTADYERVTVLVALTAVVSDEYGVDYTGPFVRFDAVNVRYRTAPDKIGGSGWREQH